MRRWRAILALAGLCALAACRQPEPAPTAAAFARAPTPAAADRDAEHERGRKVWNFRCYFCHGYSGDARTLAATYLDPPPRDFTRPGAEAIPEQRMREVIAHGKPGTAMKGFQGILAPADIAAVAAFVRREFVEARDANTRYHTAENGWPGHEQHAAAFPFARGEIALDTPWERLTPQQQHGKQLFLATCVTCHDRARVEQAGPVWETRAMSYPRDAYCTSCHEQPNGGAPRSGMLRHADHPAPAATPEAVAATYLVHDRKPAIRRASALERLGETLYQGNCAFCHAADGTAKSWIGRFLEPHPRDLTDRSAMAGMTRERLTRVIEQGIEGTSMPGWKSVLDAREIDAIVAYVNRAFHRIEGVPAPAGD